jgi:hypothetical protein
MIMNAAASRAVTNVITRGAACYDRSKLRELIRVSDEELADTSPAGRERILRILRNAVEVERLRAQERSWLFDGNRLIALRMALAGEKALAEEREAA